ncbi:hypothetical protein Riv7116_6608 [Rivularia sp. PCC 7116]|nr:hypothetical protein Riv7116_6608 [Rivularia sp. PCC 7116]
MVRARFFDCGNFVKILGNLNTIPLSIVHVCFTEYRVNQYKFLETSLVSDASQFYQLEMITHIS